MSTTDPSSAPQAPPQADAPQEPEGLQTEQPEVVTLSREDALLVENKQLKLAMSHKDVLEAQAGYQAMVQSNAELTVRLSQRYKIDATRYLFNPQNGTLVRQRPRPVETPPK